MPPSLVPTTATPMMKDDGVFVVGSWCQLIRVMDVENFFGLMRKRWVYPYFLQYLNNRSRTSEERAKMLTTKAFSYHTGVKRKDRHYDESGVATTVKIHRREGHQNSRRSEAVQGID